MTRLRSVGVVLAAVGALFALGGSNASAQKPPYRLLPCPLGGTCYRPAPRLIPRCRTGDVCIYPGRSTRGWPKTYYRYGTYNLHNEYGYHLVVNNQYVNRYTDAILTTWTGYNGGGSWDLFWSGDYGVINLTPINSITLSAQ